MRSRASLSLGVLFSTILAASGVIGLARASDKGVKIGVLTDMSGGYSVAAGAGAVEAAKMAAEDFGGRVLGAPVEVVVADHQNRAIVALEKAREWYDVGGVDAIFEMTTSSVAIAVFQATRERRKIAVAAGAVSFDLSGKYCSPYAIQWSYDDYALALGTGGTAAQPGNGSWFFLTLESPLGHSIETDTAKVIEAAGGKVAGTARFPSTTSDFWPLLLRARSSNADVIALIGGPDGLIDFARQAHQLDLAEGRHQKLASLVPQLTDIDALGLQAAQGMILTDGFYWDRTDVSRMWSRRFFERRKRMPTTMQASVYSSVLHYLGAVTAAGTVETDAVMRKMREMPVRDIFTNDGRIGPDGRMAHDMYVMLVKSPQESRYPWDYYKVLKIIPAAQAFPVHKTGDCLPLIGPKQISVPDR